MTFRILIGYDGSKCAEAALDDLKRAGLPHDVEARIFSVSDLSLPPPLSSDEIVEAAMAENVAAALNRVYSQHSLVVQEAQLFASRASNRVKRTFPDWKVSAEVLYGSPARELLFKADQWKPDLIVVGSHGRTALLRFVLGSVSQRVLKETTGSVRVARGRNADSDSARRIIIGVDGFPASEAAVRAVAGRKWPPRSEVILMVVDDPPVPTILGGFIPPLAKTIAGSNKEDRTRSENVLEQCAAHLSDPAIKVRNVIRHGDPKRELPKAAEEWGADCIFVGSGRFSNRLERFVLGSVSAAVAARAHCSVEVIRQSL